MNQLEQIEQRFNFNYPQLYKQLYNAGMLDWGESNPKWHEIYFEKLKSNPPLLLFGNDYEPLDFDRVVKEIEEIRDPNDYRKIKPELQFIPFGQTGAGDLYVFQYDRQNGSDVPITLAYHDETTAVFLAKNLQDFISRQLLEVVTDIDEYSSIAEDNFEANRINILKTHKTYLTQRQAEKLTEVYGRQLFEYNYKVPNGREFSATGLISREELKEILQQEIGFDELDKEFEYMG